MKKILKYSLKMITLFIYWLSLSSCNKYLESKPDSTLVSPSSLSDIQALLDNPSTMNQTRTPSMGTVSADEYFLTTNLYNSAEGIKVGSQNLYTWKSYPTVGTGNDWAACYLPIYNANLALDLLSDIKITDSNKKQWDFIQGEALYFRSYYFLQLLWNYSLAYDSLTAKTDLGIVLRLNSNYNIPSVRSNLEDSYNQVINDIKKSLSGLDNYAVVVTRPSKVASYALLARCYLSMRIYEMAERYADSALNLQATLIDYNGDDNIKTTLSAKGVFIPFNKEIIFYTEMNRNNFLYNTVSFSRIDTSLYSLYNDADLRKKAFYFFNNDGYPSFKGSYANSYSNCFSGLATDEILLIRAECHIRRGNIQNGIADLNRLRQYRLDKQSYQPINDINSSNALLDTVLEERKRELLMRGLRWSDIKRLNKEGASIILRRKIDNKIIELPPNSSYYALPIPDDIITMTGMEQND